MMHTFRPPAQLANGAAVGAAVVAGALSLSGCGSATPDPGPAPLARPAVSGEEEPTVEAAKPKPPPPPPSCDDHCTELLDKASASYGRAQQAGEGPETWLQWEVAGHGYVKAWRGCRLAAPEKLDGDCVGSGDVVPFMVRAYEMAHRDDRAMFAYLVGLDSRWRHPDVAGRAPEALRKLAERAAKRVKSNPKAQFTAEGLAAAAYAWLALEEPVRAAKAVGTYRRNYQRRQPAEAVLLQVALGLYHLDHGAPGQAVRHLGTAPRGKLPVRVSVLWHSVKGRALAGAGQPGASRGYLRKTAELWSPARVSEPGKEVGPAAPAPMLGREAVVDALGAAQFSLAEQLERKARQHEMPAFTGKATVEAVEDHIQSRVAKWISTKQTAVTETTEAYRRVGKIRPVPPARWVVAAEAQIGQLWADFASDFASAPVPPHVAASEGLAKSWKQAHDQMEERLLDKARPAFEACSKVAKHHRIDDEHSSRCGQWLRGHPASQ